MKLTVLGINGPFPAPGGACSGYLLSSDSGRTNVLLDCGSGVLGRMQRFVDIHSLSAIVLSHLHFDHMSDMLPLHYLLQFNKLERNIPVIAPEEPLSVRKLLENDQLDLMTPQNLVIGEMRLSFAPAVHPVPGVSVKVECDGRAFVYTGDTNMHPELELFCDGANMLLADAGLSEAQWNPNAPHLSARLCGEVARNSRVGGLILTHIRPGNEAELLLEEARSAYPAAVVAHAGGSYVI